LPVDLFKVYMAKISAKSDEFFSQFIAIYIEVHFLSGYGVVFDDGIHRERMR